MLCAIAEIESGRQTLAKSYTKKSGEAKMGIMQMSPKTAEWLIRELGYRTYDVAEDSQLMYKPFLSVYLAAAYLKWLSNFDKKERSEEYMVRAYKGGTKKANHKSTLPYWKKYLSVKESLPSRKALGVGFEFVAPPRSAAEVSQSKGPINATWDSRTSVEDMESLWNDPYVNKEWTKSGERRGNVRFSHDVEKHPYLSRVELMAVAEIILDKHFSKKGHNPTVLSALCEMVSMRFVNGVGQQTGLMGIDYPTACWLYKDLGYKGYTVGSLEDLKKPFVSMYFGAAYMTWLSEYDGRERSPPFLVQAYLSGPQNVSIQETGPLWDKFVETSSRFQKPKKDSTCCGCTIM